jgi:polar amino acid transport system substrate-binding protein
MTMNLRLALILLSLGASIVAAYTQQAPDPRVADLVRAGQVRVALFLPQYTKNPTTGDIHGDVHLVEIARALAARLDVKLVLVYYPTPKMAVEGLKAGSCDVAFLGIDRSRTGELGFSPPFAELDFTYLVPAGSSIRSVADADRPGVRIAAIRNHESTLALNRILKHATLVYTDTPEPAFDLLRTGRADAWASVGFALQPYSARLPGSRVLEDGYGANRQAMAVAKDEAGRLSYISEFIEEAKASGLVQRAIDHGGLHGIHVAPAGNPE